jgi:hypothetical protein
MNEQSYIDERLENQIVWYDKKSCLNKKYHKISSVIEIITAATIPFLSGMSFKYKMIVIGFLGVLITVISSMKSLFKFHENWIEYRTTAETLRHEKYLYKTKSGIYSSDDSFSTLVERVEGMISKENTKWSQYVYKKSNKIIT